MLLPPRDEGSQVPLVRRNVAGRRGLGPQRSPAQQEKDCRYCLEQWSNECLNAPEREPQSGERTDPQQPPQSLTQRPQGPQHHYTQAGCYPGLHPTFLAAAQGRIQPQVMNYLSVLVSSRGPLFTQDPAPLSRPVSSSREPVKVVPLELSFYLSFRSQTALCALALPAPYGLTL